MWTLLRRAIAAEALPEVSDDYFEDRLDKLTKAHD